MNNNNSTTATKVPALPSGHLWGFVGVLAFSFTVPFTRVAVSDGAMSALFVGVARASVAGILASIVLLAARQNLPTLTQLFRVGVVAAGVVFGFPFFTSYALTEVPSNHAAVVIGLLPAATAVATVLRTGERPAKIFWFWSLLGAFAATAFVIVGTGGIGAPSNADMLLIGAVIAAAIGYAEGGVLSRELGSWQTVSWALVLSLPLTVPLTFASYSDGMSSASLQSWLAFAYLALVSMYLGFFAWYRGLSIGPMAQVSQIQLTQPVMTIAWSAILLEETVPALTILAGAAVITCALLAVRTRT